MSSSSAAGWQGDDLARARSFTQHLFDTLGLASIIGAVNGFVVGLAFIWILGAIVGAVLGAIAGLLLWLPGSAVTWWLVIRLRRGRMTPRSFRRWTTALVAALGAAPMVYFAVAAVPQGQSVRTVVTLAGGVLLGAASGAWAGRRIARLQLERSRPTPVEAVVG